MKTCKSTTRNQSAKICNSVKLQATARRDVSFIQLALSFKGKTKTALIADLKARGLPSGPKSVERVRNLQKEFAAARSKRYINRANLRINTKVSSLPTPRGPSPVLLPIGTPSERLNLLRRNSVIAVAKKLLKNGAPGGTHYAVKFAESSTEVKYETDLGSNRDVYRGAYKGWHANVDYHEILVPSDWRTRVQRKGLADVDGMFTLDAQQLVGHENIQIFAAVWASQGRGYGVKTERGFIAKNDTANFHAATANEAVTGLLKKCHLTAIAKDIVGNMEASTDEFIAKYEQYDVNVSLSDARKTGSCEYGIQSWCESVGIDVDRQRVSMAEMLRAFRMRPQPEVRRAIIRAVRTRAKTPSTEVRLLEKCE